MEKEVGYHPSLPNGILMLYEHHERTHLTPWALMTYVFVAQGRDLESAFEAGPSSSTGQQEGHEVSFKGVGTFQVDANEKDRLLRKDRSSTKARTAALPLQLEV